MNVERVAGSPWNQWPDVHGMGGRMAVESALEPKAKTVALPIEDFHSITVAIQENEQHGVKHRDLDIQFDEGGQAVDGLSKVNGLGVQINFFDFGVGTHHG